MVNLGGMLASVNNIRMSEKNRKERDNKYKKEKNNYARTKGYNRFDAE